MLEGILKGLLQWVYGLFLDLISYCANALLGIMSTDLAFFEHSVPIVPSLYQIFVAVGWGLLIGNMAFQSMKAMFAGLGVETESPLILMLRTFLFGTLLIFSKDICDIGLSITKNVIDLLGIPKNIELTMPDETYFTGSSSWLLVIIVGFILGFQLIKLFFEIGERYVIVAILTLLMPVGLAMGGSKSTRDICSGYMRTYASMLVLMVTNVLFLKLILSALAAMPMGALVLPWCLLVVGLARTARKADNLIARIGMNPAMTGDPLGTGRGMVMAAMAARTIMYATNRGGSSRSKGNSTDTNSTTNNNRSHKNGGAPNNQAGNKATNNVYNGSGNKGGNGSVNNANVNNSNVNNGSVNNNSSHQNGFSKGGNSRSNVNSNNSARFGSASYSSSHQAGNSFSKVSTNGAGRGSKVNTDRFGIQKETKNPVAPIVTKAEASNQKNGTNQQIQKFENTGKQGTGINRKNRFGSSGNGGIRHNPNTLKQSGKTETQRKPNGKPNKNPNLPHVPNSKSAAPDKVRFGKGKHSRFKDDDILISREDDNDV